MTLWKIACVQTDCRIGDVPANLKAIRAGLRDAARLGARLAVFPECTLTGYCFDSREEARPFARARPARRWMRSPPTARAGRLGRRRHVGARRRRRPVQRLPATSDPASSSPRTAKSTCRISGWTDSPRRATAPSPSTTSAASAWGCAFYDGSFPESARVLTVLGADLLVLPTNWPTSAADNRAPDRRPSWRTTSITPPATASARSRGYHFIGQSRISSIATANCWRAQRRYSPEIITADIDPAVARNKRLVKIPGKYELDRVAHRRPEMYRPLAEPRLPLRPPPRPGEG